jgi:hypothetical protein
MARRIVTHRDQMSMNAQLRRAYSDHTRFQRDFGEDMKSGEPMDEQQLRFIDYLRRFHDMKDNATGDYHPRPTLNTAGIQDRNQWSMWDNGAFHIHPATGEKVFLPQADIPRTDIINQGLAGATGFTLARRHR